MKNWSLDSRVTANMMAAFFSHLKVNYVLFATGHMANASTVRREENFAANAVNA